MVAALLGATGSPLGADPRQESGDRERRETERTVLEFHAGDLSRASISSR